jgi:ferredoxin-NADP reductase
MLEWQSGTVTRIEQATHNTRRYWIELSGTEVFRFQPGQFVTLDLPVHEQRNKRWRSYSIASAPDDSNVIELVISHVAEGLGTNYLFNQVRIGSILSLRGPQGVFTLPAAALAEKDLYLVCTGTGIAPFRSMLHYMERHQLPHREVHLIFGCRTRGDLLYADEMDALAQRLEHFHYHPTLSREQWSGHTGYVHAIYEDLCRERKPAIFMLCGWREMISEARKRLADMGCEKKDILLELYG